MSHTNTSFHDALIELMPRLKRYAKVLAVTPESSDDLLQTTLERALEKQKQWQQGSHLDRWLFTIMSSTWKNEIRSRVVLPASVAASLMLGLMIGYSVFSTNSSPDKQNNNWVTEVANYQLLYVRDTVVPAPTISESQKTILETRLTKALGSELSILDLSKQQLTFRRGQVLDINGKPLIQLVYLPDDGLPVALCILRSDVADTLPKSGESRSQSFIEWSKNGLSYVIIGKTNKKNLETAAMMAIAQI